jgi:hypothetical protein
MMRVTPLRFTTLQFSQIGFTLLRTFTGRSSRTMNYLGQDSENNRLSRLTQGAKPGFSQGPLTLGDV